MAIVVLTFLTLLTRFTYIVSTLRPCVPNTEVDMNGKICYCNNRGQWSDASCHLSSRKQICTPGKVIWQGCNQCICQENGQLTCVDGGCSQQTESVNHNFHALNAWCTPFRSYYVDCSLCICPASGRISEAHCAKDTYCSLQGQPTFNDLARSSQACIPKVMYLFPCLHCLCSDDGVFVYNKCVETCQKQMRIENGQKCTPRTFYRRNCNVCQCPDDGTIDDKLCTKSVCNQQSYFGYLRALRSKSFSCIPHSFMKPRCLYCDCSSKGTVDENSCLELDCLEEFKYDVVKQTCKPGEAVPICMECLCLRNGQTNVKYCSKVCTYESMIAVLEEVLRDSIQNVHLVDQAAIRKDALSERCQSYSIYIDRARYCLCPENGITNFNLCTLNKETSDSNLKPIQQKINGNGKKINIDFNVTCEPSTFVEFDCNTCFCSKKGNIDPKWCTYDDCEAKRVIQESHDSHVTPKQEINENCYPGSISKVECNFCICPDSGSTKDRVCTKNDCSAFVTSPGIDKFVCEPLAYYEVDCNVCFCPRDGLKNVAKCTKNHCEKSFLRSDVCVPGQLFSDECNVCVCPPNGNKLERACTNYTCSDTTPWKKIFQLSESLLGNQVAEDATRNLELCFPGEEFVVGCKLCVCPDMGLRVYAICTPMLCENEESVKPTQETSSNTGKNRDVQVVRKSVEDEGCLIYNVSYTKERQNCEPGSIFVTGCRQCICPARDGADLYCRLIPKDYCESTLDQESNSQEMSDAADTTKVHAEEIKHAHTMYKCLKPGKVMDECFVCECLEINSLIFMEHCFKSDAESCVGSSPSFLSENNKIGFG